MTENIKRSVCISADMKRELEKYSRSQHISVSECIRSFIEQGLSLAVNNEKKSEIRQDIYNSLQDILPDLLSEQMKRLTNYQFKTMKAAAATLMCITQEIHCEFPEASREDILAQALAESAQYCGFAPLPYSRYQSEAQQILASCEADV